MGKAKKPVDDRFMKFGTVGFTATTKVNDFVTNLENGKVTGTRCKSCGRTYFPPRADCCQCLESDMEWFPIQGRGKLVTFSRLSFGPAGFKEDVPYTIAVVDYGNYKVFGRIADGIEEDQLVAGMEMTVRANHLANGQLNYVFEKA